MFELIYGQLNVLELSRALRLFSVHCNVKVYCALELSRKEKNTKKHKKEEKKKKKNIKRDKKKKWEESEEDGGYY